MTARHDAVDVARGLALVAMAAYHFTWDLAYFGLVAPATPFTPAMRLASHGIACAFLALAGLSLALAHPDGLRPRPFLKRALRIGAAAALVSGATLAFAPKSPILFGILHCILVASLVAAPLVARPRAALALGAALAVAPLFLRAPVFNAPWLMWLGLNTQDPATLDWRPLMPWGGALLIGLGLARLAPLPPARPARGAPLGALAFAGRHSLAVYLVHQPILVGLLYAGVHLSGFADRQSAASYERACRPACVEAGGDAESCARACACVVRDASAAGLSGRLGASALGAPERARIGGIVNACAQQPR